MESALCGEGRKRVDNGYNLTVNRILSQMCRRLEGVRWLLDAVRSDTVARSGAMDDPQIAWSPRSLALKEVRDEG